MLYVNSNNGLKTGSASPYFSEKIPNVEVEVGSFAVIDMPMVINPDGSPYSIGFSP